MHALPHSKSSVFLCAVFYVVHVSGSLAPIRRRCCRQQDLHALASRGSQAVCVCIRVCVYAGVTRGTLDIHHTHTQTRTSLSAQAQFLAPGIWKAPNYVGSLTLVTEELSLLLNFLFSLPHNLSMTPSQLFFSSQYFHAVFVLFLFLLPCFLSERNIVQKHI